jgi:hypothetical protein
MKFGIENEIIEEREMRDLIEVGEPDNQRETEESENKEA